jgi:hypothetical protein
LAKTNNRKIIIGGIDDMKQKENPKKTIRILWTGGWDSTYRIIELSRQPVAIQPIYVYGDGRVSEPFERRAMQKILTQLKNKIGFPEKVPNPYKI